jgi:ferredoxin
MLQSLAHPVTKNNPAEEPTVPSIIINDVEMEAKVGEKLLGVARRNAAHIGFVCDGNGVCQTCQCRVLAGAEQLSPPSEAERAWMPERRLADGHRLACQAVIRGEGHVEVLTTAEELRRQMMAVIAPRRGEDRRDSLEPLLENLVRMNVDQLVRFPWNILAAAARVGLWRFTYPVLDERRYLDDGARVARKMLSGVDRIEREAANGTTPRPLANGAAPRRIAPPREEQVLEAARNLRRAREALKRRA